MSKLLLTILVIIQGCGGEIPADANAQFFMAKVDSKIIRVKGFGKTEIDREYDAVAYIASTRTIPVNKLLFVNINGKQFIVSWGIDDQMTIR